MTLSFFPSLLDLARLAPVILRLAVAIIFLAQASSNFKQGKKAGSGVRTIIGILLLLGLYTQGAALAGIAITIWDFKKKSDDRRLLFLLGTILLSLLFLGAGLWAFDLPL